MADPPRPRAPGQPPPLPLRVLPTVEHTIPPEPFVDLTAEERAADTQPSGARRDALPPPPPEDPLTETTARLLRQDLALVREALPTVPALQLPPAKLPTTPGSLPPDSLRTATKKALAARVGKWSGYSVVSFLLPLIGAYVAQRWPQYADLSTWLLGWLP